MLPGLIPFMSAAVAFAIPVFATASAAAPSVNWPAGVQAGDFALLFSAARKGTDNSPSAVTPSGFTVLYNDTAALGNNNTGRAEVYYRICNGSETGTITALNDDNEGTILVVYRPTKAITSASAFGGNKNGESGNITPMNIATTGQSAPVIAYGIRISPSGSPLTGPAGSTIYGTTNVDAGVYPMLTAESLQTTTWDVPDNGNWNGLFAGGIALTVAA